MKAYKVLIDKKRNLNHNLLLVGRKGWKADSIYETAKNLNLNNEVKFLGYKEGTDLTNIVQHANLFISPSIYESFCFPALEAMACGVPSVVSKDTGTAEIVRDAGLLVNPYDIDEIADAIYTIISQKGLRKDLSRKAIDRAQNFSWQKCAVKTLNVYEEVYEK